MINHLKLGAFDDVSLVFADGETIPAHRIVLSAASPLLKDLLTDSSSVLENSQIFLPSFDHLIMRKLTSFLYSGEAFLKNKEELDQFMEYCDYFGLKAFKDVKPNEVRAFKNMLNEPNSGKVNNKDHKVANFSKNNFDLEADEKDLEGDNKGNVHIAPETEQDHEYKSEPKEILLATGDENKVLTIKQRIRKGRIQIRKKRKAPTQSLNCHHCSYTTVWPQDIKRHKASKHESVKYNCDQCDSEFKGRRNLKIHKLGIHEGFSYSCSNCSYTSISKPSLKAHTQSQHDGVNFQCLECPDKFRYKHSLRKHTESKHLGKQFPCKCCPKIFYRTDNLTNHMNSVHYGLVYNCDISECNFSTKRKYEVKMHKKSIHDNSMFSCTKENCKFETDTYIRFNRHKVRVHPNRLHKCTFCEFKDPESYRVKAHMDLKHNVTKVT